MGYPIFVGIIGLAFLFVLIGTLVEVTKLTDLYEVRAEEDANPLYEASKFRRLEQYDSVLVQRKNDCGRRLLAFSFLRNIIRMNVKSSSLRTAIENEKKDVSISKDRRIAQNL